MSVFGQRVDYDMALKHNPNNAYNWFGYGTTLYSQGKRDEAMNSYEGKFEDLSS